MSFLRRCSSIARPQVRGIWLLIPALALLAAAGCSGKTKVEKLYDEGMLFYKHRSYYQAIDKFEEALTLQPDDATVLVRAADANLKIGKPEQAIKYGTSALAKNPKLDEASLIVGEAHLELALSRAKPDKDGKPIFDAAELAAAGQVSSELRKRKPDSIEATVLDARIDFFSDKIDDAERLYRTVLAKDPANVNAQAGLIDLLMSGKQYVEAEALARNAVANTPKDTTPNPIFVGQLANSMAGQKRYDEAYQTLEPYVEVGNKNPVYSLYATAGNILLAQLNELGKRSDLDPAMLDAGTTASLTAAAAPEAAQTPPAEAAPAAESKGAPAATIASREEQAKTAVERLASLGAQMKGSYPNLAESWYLRGLSYEFQGDMPNAIRHFQEATNRSPDQKKYRYPLALAYLMTNALTQAEQEVSNLLKFEPGDFDGRLLMAAVKIAEGSNAEGLRILEDLKYLKPDDPRMLQMLTQQLIVSGDPAQIEEGLANLQKLIDMKAIGAEYQGYAKASAQFSEGLALARQGKATEAADKLKEAEKALLEFVAKQPKNANAEVMLAELSEYRRDFFGALEHAHRASQINPRTSSYEAKLYMGLGQYDKAAEIYKKLLAAAPDATGNMLALANIDLRQKNTPEALKMIDALIAKNPDDFANYINKARALASSDQIDAALQALEEGRKKLPNETAIPVEMARIEIKRNRVDEAITLLTAAQKAAADQLTLKRAQAGNGDDLKMLTADVASLNLELATDELFAGKYDASADHARASQQVSGGPDYETAIIGAIAQFGKNQPEAAVQSIDKAKGMVKNEPPASMLLRGLGLAMQDKRDEAQKAVDEAAGLDSGTKELFKRLVKEVPLDALVKASPSIAVSVVMAGAANYAAAVNDACDAALKLLPGNPFVISRKAETLGMMGDADASLKAYDQLALAMPESAAVPTVQTEIHLAQQLRAASAGDAKTAQAEGEKAEASARQAVKLDPKNTAMLAKLALILQSENKMDEANALYRNLIEIDPANWTAYNNLAYNLATGGKLDDAQGVAEKALEHAPAQGDARMANIRGAIQDTAGWIQLQKGDGAKALEYLEPAVQNDPNNPEIRIHLAQALEKTGDKEKAAAQLESIVQTLPAYSKIGEVREQLRKLKPDSEYLKPAATGA